MQEILSLCLTILLVTSPSTGDVTADFNSVLSEFWDWRLSDYPEFATAIGENKYNDKLTSYNITEYAKRKETVDQYLGRLDKIDEKKLSAANQVNYIIFKDALDTYSGGYKWFDYGALNPVNFLDGFQTDPSSLPSRMPFKTEADFENYLKRLEQIQTRLEEQTDLFRRAIELNRTLNKVSVDRIPGQIEKFLTDDVTQFSLYQPFNESLDNLTLPDEEKEALRQRAVSVLQTNVMAPYRTFKTFLENDYFPATRPGWGVSSWGADGQNYYAACLKWHLSEPKTAQEIHDLGLQEVARISGQMLKLIKEIDKDFDGTIRQYFQLLKEDSRFKLNTSEAILQEYRDIVFERVDPKLKDFFINIPQLPLEVRPMTYDGPGGAYSSGSADGSRPGIFWVNTMRPESTNTFDMMALTLHEANPGHHMQISRSLLLDQPNFRKYRFGSRRFKIPFSFASYTAYTELSAASLLTLPAIRKFNAYSISSAPYAFPAYTAYVEGWGLYSEYMGEEMGLYKDGYERLGRYSGEIFRACRLVVDTGLHSLGWDREEAIQYMLNYTSSDRPDIEVEIDRYITWPGQACAYKYGEIKIKALRQKAEKELGNLFDLKKFHDTILGLAAVPLQVLEAAIDTMIQEVKDAQKQPSGSILVQSSVWVVFMSALFKALVI